MSDGEEPDAACLPKPKKLCLDREFQPGSLPSSSSAGENTAYVSSSINHVTQDELEAVKIVERMEAIEKMQAMERMEADHKMALELDRQWNGPEEQRRRKSPGSPSCKRKSFSSPSCSAGLSMAGPSSSTLLSSLSLASPSHASCSSTTVSPIPLAQQLVSSTDPSSLFSTPAKLTENHFITTDSDVSTTSSHTPTAVTTELPSWWTKCSSCSPESLLNKPYHLIHLSLTEDPENEQLVDTLTTQKILYSFIKCNLQVVNIWRIQNPSLWRRYGAEKVCMVAERGKDFDLNEELLFHTSRSPSKSICSEGLDMRLSRTGCFGKGIYFSDSPTKCNCYNHQKTKRRLMYACSVLLGDTKKYPPGEFDKELVREPPKEGDTSSYYDSVQGFIKDGNEYVIYNNYRALPQYLVEYKQ